ncbi:hypothetical protein IFM89_035854 [Coptis chinensis]|uniref:Uncharacterized protein n=1 Tax=Coptis chinensis TaxID=261450 RepID=A0A835HSF2_9MAGN|nr:hypothetical protein IFM89_035854 [Coptis chinensis]
MLPVSADVFAFMNVFSYDISYMKNSEFLFVRSSPTTAKIWVEKFIYKIAIVAKSLLDSNSRHKEQTHFGHLAVNTLEGNSVRIRRVDELSFALDIGVDSASQTAIRDGQKMVYWSSEMSLDLIQKRLGDMGMWVVDGDNSCTSVICHQS